MNGTETTHSPEDSQKTLEYTTGFVGCGIRSMDSKGRVSFPANQHMTWNDGSTTSRLEKLAPILTPARGKTQPVVYLFPPQALGPNSCSDLVRLSDREFESNGRFSLPELAIGSNVLFIGKGIYCMATPCSDNQSQVLQAAEQFLASNAGLDQTTLQRLLDPRLAKKLFPADTLTPAAEKTICQLTDTFRRMIEETGGQIEIPVNLTIGNINVTGTISLKRAGIT